MLGISDSVSFNELKWDTDFFGVSSAKATLHKPLTLNEWIQLQTRFKNYKFISIVNENCEPINSKFIGMDTSAFLTDINIQFKKKINTLEDKPKNITINQALEKNDEIIQMADFQFSRFIDDPKLAKLGGGQVYQKWLINSFGKSDKYYAISNNAKGDINGYSLFSYDGNACIVELIAVSQTEIKSGIGTNLFKAIEYAAHQIDIKEIKVGTQLRNLGAVNFYHKIGCRQVGCHQVYHLWNQLT